MDFVGAASDMNETISKSRNVFGDQGAAIEAWANNAAKSFGISKQAALAATGQYGDMFIQLGFTKKAAADNSESLVKMAADLGSFHNVDPSDVLERLGAAFRGEYDSLQALIPNINATRVEQEALAETHKKSAKDLTAAEKATATMAIVQKDGANALNDFAETSNGAANRQRILTAQWEDAKAKLGAGLLPVLVKVLGVFVDHLPGAIDGVTKAFKRIGAAIEPVKAIVADVWDAFLGGSENPSAKIGQNVDGLSKTFLRLGAEVGKIRDWFREILPQIQEIIRNFTKAASAFWKQWGDEIMAVVGFVFDFVWKTIETALRVIRDVINLVLGLLRGDWDQVWHSLLDIVSAVFGWLVTLLKDSMGIIWTLVSSGLSALAHAAWDAMKAMLRAFVDANVDLVKWFVDLPGNLINAMGDIGKKLYDVGSKLLQGFIDGVKSKFEDVKNTLGDLTKKLTSWKGPPEYDATLLTASGEIVIQGFMRGIDNQTPALQRKLAGLTGMIQQSVWGDMQLSSNVGINVNATINAPGADGRHVAALRQVARTEIAGALRKVIKGTTAGVGS